MKTTQEIIETEQCFCCGNDLDDGFIERDIDDQLEYVCAACATEDERDNDVLCGSLLDDIEEVYAQADRQFTEQFEEGTI